MGRKLNEIFTQKKWMMWAYQNLAAGKLNFHYWGNLRWAISEINPEFMLYALLIFITSSWTFLSFSTILETVTALLSCHALEPIISGRPTNWGLKIGGVEQWMRSTSCLENCGFFTTKYSLIQQMITWYLRGYLTAEEAGVGVIGPRKTYFEPIGKHASIF